VTFPGRNKKESRGVVDLIAIRKDHTSECTGIKKGDPFQIYLIQVKGGVAANPTAEDAARLRIVAKRHGACGVLFARWRRPKAAKFWSLRSRTSPDGDWVQVDDLAAVFGRKPVFSNWS
jgi:hypothetical protein